jgi:hypothetical protein
MLGVDLLASTQHQAALAMKGSLDLNIGFFVTW